MIEMIMFFIVYVFMTAALVMVIIDDSIVDTQMKAIEQTIKSV